jgi:mRNA interferase RelE/StbE
MPSKKRSAPAVVSAYQLAFEDTARAEWDALDGSVKEPLRKALKARLENPHVAGNALRGDLIGCYKIKLLKQGYRLVYRVIDTKLIVLVIAVGKRDKDVVYKAALKRLREAATNSASVVITKTRSKNN